MNSDVYSPGNFDFLARSFARIQAKGHLIDVQAITGNMDEEHRSWFCKRYALYYQQAMGTKKLGLGH